MMDIYMIIEESNTKRYTNSYMESVLGKAFKVHEHGFIKVVEYMGGDHTVANAARISYGKATKSVREDKALIHYLMKHGHWSPFEMPSIIFHVKLPIFVARQWIRHQGNVNEYSGRYSQMIEEFYIPSIEYLGTQSKNNKQGTDTTTMSDDDKKNIISKFADVCNFAYNSYDELLERGLSREQARMILPVAGYTEWVFKFNLRDLLHFCRQRSDSHAQHEIRDYSDIMIDTIVKEWCPLTYAAYDDCIRNAVTLTGKQVKLLLSKMSCNPDTLNDKLIRELEMSKRDVSEVKDILDDFKDKAENLQKSLLIAYETEKSLQEWAKANGIEAELIK